MALQRFVNATELGAWLRTKFEEIAISLEGKIEEAGNGGQLVDLNASALATGSVPLPRLGVLGDLANVNYTISQYPPTSVDGNDGDLWFVLEPPPAEPLALTVVSTGTETLSFSFFNPSVDGLLVDWGDGSATDVISGSTTHTYATPGTYTATLMGDAVSINTWGSALTEIVNFGSTTASTMNFGYAQNLVSAPATVPSTLTNMYEMFAGCQNFNGVISGWDVSNVIDMSYMFQGCSSFNQDLSGWNVSNVIDMSQMFNSCSIFNGNITTWNVTSVTNMSTMFTDCPSFNQDLSGWDVSGVTWMDSMFYGCSTFNQNLSGWNTGGTTNMSYMFSGCADFVQDLSGWNVVAAGSAHAGFDGAPTNASWLAGMKPVWTA